jgi:hypothetical protein
VQSRLVCLRGSSVLTLTKALKRSAHLYLYVSGSRTKRRKAAANRRDRC